MWGFAGGSAIVDFLNELILKLRILKKAKQWGVKDLDRLVTEIVNMLSRVILWTLFIPFAAITIGTLISIFGAATKDISAVVVAVILIEFFTLRVICQKPLKQLLRAKLSAR